MSLKLIDIRGPFLLLKGGEVPPTCCQGIRPMAFPPRNNTWPPLPTPLLFLAFITYFPFILKHLWIISCLSDIKLVVGNREMDLTQHLSSQKSWFCTDKQIIMMQSDV